MVKHKTLNGEIVHPSIIPSYGVHQVQLVSNLAWTTNEQWNEFRKKPPQPGPIGAADCMKSKRCLAHWPEGIHSSSSNELNTFSNPALKLSEGGPSSSPRRQSS